jgi:hypothetical protein
MEAIILKRQLITDASGKPVGAILPLNEYAMVQKFLEQNFADPPPSTAATKETTASIREAAFFGIWADRNDLQGRSSREWLEEEVRSKQWNRS